MTCNSGDLQLDAAVNGWLKLDKNRKTRKEVLDDIENSRWDKLKETMLKRLKFGTAGLRGRVGAGYNRMNDLVVLQTAQGLCSYIKKECSQSQLRNGIVVGYDGRYDSENFAELTAQVFVSESIPVHLFSTVCPTPYISFGTILYGAAAGVMVTASHNPKEDNGYKVYWGQGCQIISPHDENILEEIEQCLDIPDSHWDLLGIRTHPLVHDCAEHVHEKYMQYITNSLHADVIKMNRITNIKSVYTGMHGVGYHFIVDAFDTVYLQIPMSVYEQQEIDPDFPTVKFPNPEEPECLSLAKQLAERHEINIVLANDPDADRLAVAEFDERTRTWKVFSGNEMGALLGWWLLEQHYKKHPDASKDDVYVLASIVSSKMLRAIVSSRGQFVETLTGFKWMGNATLLLAQQNKVPIFAFEEAIGYMCDPKVPDKDGISAAVHVIALASHLSYDGVTLQQQLQKLYAEHGYHASLNSYYVCNDPATIQKIFRRIRNYHGPGEYPKKVGSREIVSVHDLTAGVKIPENEDQTQHLKVLGTGLDQEYKGGEMIQFECENGLRVTVRTSGTEPKLKYYTEYVCKANTVPEQEKVKLDLKNIVQEFMDELLQPKENGLVQ